MTKDKAIKLIDEGEMLDKPGRKFGYTNQDFLESYFGKDYSRLPEFSTKEEDKFYKIIESLEKKYPINKYL